LALGSASADTTLELKNDFIETHKNRATIEATYSPKFAHSKPKTPSPSKPSNDGDIHISGTAPEIGLLTVAEIMNAADFPKTLKHVQDNLGGTIQMVGVWRIWPEHGVNRITSKVRPMPTTSRTRIPNTSLRSTR
jgi:hypothetical protein